MLPGVVCMLTSNDGELAWSRNEWDARAALGQDCPAASVSHFGEKIGDDGLVSSKDQDVQVGACWHHVTADAEPFTRQTSQGW